MKFNKLISLFLAGVMALSMAACGDQNKVAGTDLGDKLVVWTLAADLEQFAAKYQEETGVEMEVLVIQPADYPTKVQQAILGGETEPDIIVGEPQMLESFNDMGLFADLDEFGAKDYEGKIVDYVWQVGQDKEGHQRAISYQITPAGIYYRRDIRNRRS